MNSAAPIVRPGTNSGSSATSTTPPGVRSGIARPTAVATTMQANADDQAEHDALPERLDPVGIAREAHVVLEGQRIGMPESGAR